MRHCFACMPPSLTMRHSEPHRHQRLFFYHSHRRGAVPMIKRRVSVGSQHCPELTFPSRPPSDTLLPASCELLAVSVCGSNRRAVVIEWCPVKHADFICWRPHRRLAPGSPQQHDHHHHNPLLPPPEHCQRHTGCCHTSGAHYL